MKRDVQLGGATSWLADVPCACGEKIPTPLAALLQGLPITCWNCGARLTVKQEESRESLEALGRLNERLSRIQNDIAR